MRHRLNGPRRTHRGVVVVSCSLAAVVLPPLAPAVPHAMPLTPRIVGGRPTTVARWPWQVALTVSPGDRFFNARQRLQCGGALVAPSVVITAAHCLYDSAGKPRAANTLGIVTGRSFLSSSAGREVRVRSFRAAVDRSGGVLFDYRSRRWDVAVVRLASRATATPIKLAGADERRLWRPGRAAYLTGWGRLGASGALPDRLRVAAMPIVADGVCRSRYAGDFSADVMLCAGTAGADACAHDSGDPLAVRATGGSFRLVGTVSFGNDPCGRDPGVYARLADEPMRSALRRIAFDLAGVDIVSSGSPGARRCQVPALVGESLAAATRALRRANCALGRVTRQRVCEPTRVGRVLSQKPRRGKRLRSGSRVSVVVGSR